MIPVLLDRTHKRWFVGSTLVALLGAVAYCAIGLSATNGPKGGSLLGMLFGILGSACLIFAALLAVRRRLPTLRVGSAQFWLRGHLWLGTLGFVMILFHSGFGWGGLLENLLWVSLILVVVTGVFGVILQQVIPRLLTSEVPLETMVSQIPSLARMSAFQADKLVAAKVGVLEVDFESLLADALSVLKRQEQSIGERPDDFPRELAKIYANVPLPESDKHPPMVPVVAPIVPTKPPRAPTETSPVNLADGASTAKPKSPLELMREKAAAKAAGEITPDKPEPKAIGAQPARRQNPLALKRERAALKAAEKVAAPPPLEEPAVPPVLPEPVVPPLEKKRLPAEQPPANDDAPVGVSLMSGKPMKHLISITCARCGKMFTVAPRHAGKQGRCPVDACQAPYTVPLPDEPPAEPVRATPRRDFTPPAIEKKVSLLEQLKAKISAAMTMSPRPPKPKKKLITIMCTSCGSIFTVSPRHVGKQGRCPVDACQAPYTVPFVDSVPAAPAESDNALPAAAAKSPTPIEQMRDQPAVIEAPAPSSEEPAEPLLAVEPMPVEPDKVVVPTPSIEEPAKPLLPCEEAPAKPAEIAAPEPPTEQPTKPLSPIEQVPPKPAVIAAPAPPINAPAKPLSPIEQMRAKRAAAIESPKDQSAGMPQPLIAEVTAAPPVVSSPAIVVKATVEKPVVVAPTPTPVPVKPKRRKTSAPISPALLAELRDFHINIVRPFLITGRSPLFRLDDSAIARQLFAQLRADLPTELHESIQQLFVLCDERRQFNTQLRLHRWLHWWLMVHIPPAIALMVLFVAHVVVALRVVPFGK